MSENVEENQKIWHCLQLKYFEKMLQKEALSFVRARKIKEAEDEGQVPEVVKKAHKMIYDDFPPPIDRELEKKSQCRYELHNKREDVFISCWRMDDCERTETWRKFKFEDNEPRIVIQSTYSRFKKCFRNHKIFTGFKNPNKLSDILDIFMGFRNSINITECIFIEPVDYEYPGTGTSFPDDFQCLLYYIYKDRKKYGWENELRALKFDDKFDKKYLPISTDIEILIEKIIVSPRMPKLQSEVKSLVSEHGLKVDVCKSSLNGY